MAVKESDGEEALWPQDFWLGVVDGRKMAQVATAPGPLEKLDRRVGSCSTLWQASPLGSYVREAGGQDVFYY